MSIIKVVTSQLNVLNSLEFLVLLVRSTDTVLNVYQLIFNNLAASKFNSKNGSIG